MSDDIVTRLRELPKWQQEIAERKREQVAWEILRLNDIVHAKNLLRIWLAVRGE